MKVEEKDSAKPRGAPSYAEPKHLAERPSGLQRASFALPPSSLCTMPERVEYPSMTVSAKINSPIKFGTSGWRGLIADDFTFANVRLAVTAIAEHTNAEACQGARGAKGAKGAGTKSPTVLVGYDTRFYSEEFSQLAVEILQQHNIRTLLCETFTPTPAIAYEIMRRKLDGAINFTASHNPAQYHGLKFSSSDAGPALPEVTKDIEARVVKIIGKGGPFPRGARDARRPAPGFQEGCVRAMWHKVRSSFLVSPPFSPSS